jgi:phosphatidate phosphatase LPIN
VQEYSWEWGAFPQPSPMKTSFGKGRFDIGKTKSKARLEPLESEDDIDLQLNMDEEPPAASILRSQSVPPELDGSPSLKRRELPAPDDEQEEVLRQETGSFGAGGRLTSSRSDPTRFRVHIEGKTVAFELSIVDSDESRRGKIFDGMDEVEATTLFENGKIDYRRFLDDETVVRDGQLVIRWVGGQ